MTTLSSLIDAVKIENLTKTQIENLRDDMAHLYSLYQLETAKIKKEKSLYFLRNPEKTNVATENKWAVTESGLRETDLKYECRALKELLSSVKHRLYNLY